MSCDVGEVRTDWRMNCDVGKATEGLENELWRRWSDAQVGEWAPTFPSLHLRHKSFSNPSVALPTSQLILQPFFRFSYVTSSSLNSPGEPPMQHRTVNVGIHLHCSPCQFIVLYRLRIVSETMDSYLNKRYGHTAHTFSRLMSSVIIWERYLSKSIRFQMIDNYTFLSISPPDLIT